MMRILGVLVGSALAVAALVMLIGVPRMQTESRHAPIGDNGIIRLPERATAAEPVAAVQPDPAPAPPPAAAAVEPDEEPVVAPPEMPVEQPALPDEQPPVEIVNAVDVVEDVAQWYAFWSPFRTQIAADGFVAQLQRVTGLDYRVVKVETGVYEVAFAYSDDDEIMANLSQISAATGLQLPAN